MLYRIGARYRRWRKGRSVVPPISMRYIVKSISTPLCFILVSLSTSASASIADWDWDGSPPPEEFLSAKLDLGSRGADSAVRHMIKYVGENSESCTHSWHPEEAYLQSDCLVYSELTSRTVNTSIKFQWLPKRYLVFPSVRVDEDESRSADDFVSVLIMLYGTRTD